jgi:hypothetical protein
MKILENDINQNNTKEFIEDYKKLRYTIETKNRITLLNKYKKISPGNKIQDFNVSYESKEPKQLLQRFLLDLIELYNKCLDESVLKPAQFYDYFSSIMGREGYDIGKAFFGPGNFGNSNLKFSLLFSEFLTIFDAIKFDENKNQVKDHFIKNRFERKLVLLKLFYTTIKNENNILNSELYYKYLKIINTILLMCAKTRNTVSVKNMIILINNCMINLIQKKDLKNFIKNNPNKLFIKLNGKEIELSNDIIDTLLLNETLIYKKGEINLDFDIKLYNRDIFNELEINLIIKDWKFCNFEYIETYNFINSNENLKKLFKDNILSILRSPYMKKIYYEVENRFYNNNNYLFENNDEIFNEIFEHIIFFPFPIDSCYGYSNKNSFDIYINMYDRDSDVLELFGKFFANSNDIIHEIYHISAIYYIINSKTKNINDFTSRIPSKKKKEYLEIQKKFLKDTNSKNLNTKKEDVLDFGDAIEIECFGFCIREFSLKNICELFVKDTWYKENMFENFKINYINNSKISEEDEKDIKNEDKIDIIEYKNKSDIIKIFFEAFPLEDESKRYYKNEIVYIRKRDGNYDETYSSGIVYSRELGLSRPQILYFNRYIEGGRLPFKG